MHSTAQHSTAQDSTAQHSTAQHSTAQDSTAQHSTAQHSTAPSSDKPSFRDLTIRVASGQRLRQGLLHLVSCVVLSATLCLGVPQAKAEAPYFVSGFESIEGPTVLAEDVVLLQPGDHPEWIELKIEEGTDTSLILDPSLPGVDQVAVGEILHVQPGVHDGLPFGIAGRVVAITTDPQGRIKAELEPVTLAEVYDDVKINIENVPLTADNFVGLITPDGVERSADGVQYRLEPWQKGISLLDGGVILRSGASSPGEPKRSAGVAGTDYVFPGDIPLNLELKLSKAISNPADFTPYGSGKEAKFVVSGVLSNLTASGRVDTGINWFAWPFPRPKINEMNVEVKGDLEIDVKFQAGISGVLGVYDSAWDSVVKVDIPLIGLPFAGLDSDDKVGKLPIAGLVFALPCPTGCPQASAQTAVPLAKALGVIVWVNINARGDISLDAEAGVRLRETEFVLAMDKRSKNDPITHRQSFRKKPTVSGSVLDAPYIEGSLSAEWRFGANIAADVFLLGVRIANVSSDIGVILNGEISGQWSNSVPNWGQPFQTIGGFCTRLHVGGGALVYGRAGLGIETEVGDDWTGSANYIYGFEYPSESARETEGWHGGIYFSAPEMKRCTFDPEVTGVSATRVGNEVTIRATGSNLPHDLHLDIDQSECQLALYTATEVTPDYVSWTCLRTSPAGITIPYQLSSGTASTDSNLTGATIGALNIPEYSEPVLRPLNDTGILTSGRITYGYYTPCDLSYFTAQDCNHGRDALAISGQLSKVGAGNGGFDFTKISNTGAVLSSSATLGSGPNDWACTRDNVTGLIWEVKVNDPTNLRHKDYTYSWFNPYSQDGNSGVENGGACHNGGRCDTEKFVVDVNNQGLCGKHDWRMPTWQELQSIADYGQFYPAIDLEYFPNTDPITFWTSTPSAADNRAFLMWFDDGFSGAGLREDSFSVRLVRNE